MLGAREFRHELSVSRGVVLRRVAAAVADHDLRVALLGPFSPVLAVFTNFFLHD